MKITLSKKQWQLIGKKAGWTKQAQIARTAPTNSLTEQQIKEKQNQVDRRIKKINHKVVYSWRSVDGIIWKKRIAMNIDRAMVEIDIDVNANNGNIVASVGPNQECDRNSCEKLLEFINNFTSSPIAKDTLEEINFDELDQPQ